MKITTVQAAHSYGVLDPQMVERRDTKFVDGSLSDGLNIIVKPQGGYTSRGGTTDFGRVRRRLAAIALDVGMVSAPNGGAAADLFDPGSRFSSDAAAGAAFVVLGIDFGAARLVHFVDAGGLSATGAGGANAIFVQYWDGAAWHDLGGRLKLTTGAQTRRFASGAPGHAGHSATKIRLCADAGKMTGSVELDRVAVWSESADPSDGLLWHYSPERDMACQLVLTDRNIDVFERGIWKAAVAIPATEAIIREIKPEAKLDTILAFHQDMYPQRLYRLGTSTEWACDEAPFKDVPLVDYGETYNNVVDEVQEIAFYNVANGDKFDLTLEGQTTAAITYNTTTISTDIANAISALPNVSSGITVVAIHAQLITVTFTGDGNSGINWGVMAASTLEGDGYVRVRTTIQGDSGGEKVFSQERGYPAVGRFWQQRLLMAGLKSQPNGLLASVLGDPFSLNTKLSSGIAALSYELDAPENNEIRDIMAAQTLVFLGSQQAAFLKSTGLSADEAPSFGQTDAPGMKGSVPAVTSGNAIYYVQVGGKSLQIMSYSELEQNFVPDNAGVLSAFLIRDPVDQTRRRPADGIDADMIVHVNADGSVTVLTVMRTQEVSGFAPWSTDGAFASAVCDASNDLWFLVRRLDDGAQTLRLEKYAHGKLLDEAVEIEQASSATVGGLARFNGRQVWAIANDQVFGPFAVEDGTIVLTEEASEIRVGTWVAPTATDPDVSLEQETRQRQSRLKRVNRAVISVIDTTSLAIRVNDGAIVDVPLWNNEEIVLDQGPLARPVTGKVEADGMHGFSDHGRLTITQLYPGFLTVRSVTKNIAA